MIRSVSGPNATVSGIIQRNLKRSRAMVEKLKKKQDSAEEDARAELSVAKDLLAKARDSSGPEAEQDKIEALERFRQYKAKKDAAATFAERRARLQDEVGEIAAAQMGLRAMEKIVVINRAMPALDPAKVATMMGPLNTHLGRRTKLYDHLSAVGNRLAKPIFPAASV